MPCECCAVGLDEIFGDRVARHEAKRFRKKGLPVRSRRLLDAIEETIPLRGTTAREVGAGVGGLTITLLQRGVARASIIDAVSAYVSAADTLAREFGVADDLDIELGDYVARAPALPDVDLLVLDRVVCCYPAWPDLLEAAAGDARGVIALTWPRDVWWVRFGIGVVNMVQRLRRQSFRVFVHPPPAMRELLSERGFRTNVVGHRGVWDLIVADRRYDPHAIGNPAGN